MMVNFLRSAIFLLRNICFILEDFMTRFVVDLGDVALSKEVAAAINADIQKAVMVNLAGISLPQPMVFRFPREWLGLIIRPDFDALLKGEEQLQRGLLQARGAM
jgi:hypothetical protein